MDGEDMDFYSADGGVSDMNSRRSRRVATNIVNFYPKTVFVFLFRSFFMPPMAVDQCNNA